MKEEVFAKLMKATEEALDHARGKRELRTTTLPKPPEPMNWSEVKRLRARVRTSQAVFAHYLNVSTKLVQAWEARRRAPEGAALRLLRLAERYPAVVFPDIVSDAVATPDVRRVRVTSRSSSVKVPLTTALSASGSKKGRPKRPTVANRAG